jgi:stage IV sporulation protein FB
MGQSWLSTFAGQVLVWLLVLNVIMVPFNMLPAFPMDGGRVLRAILSSWLRHYQGTRIAVFVGFGMALLIGLAGTFGNYMLPVIAFFVIFAGQQELMAAKYRERQRQKHAEDGEPLEVLPVGPRRAAYPMPQAPVLMFQPKISVYTWDNQTGTWRQEPSASA